MAAAPAPAGIPIHWDVQLTPVGSLVIPVGRLRVTLEFATRLPGLASVPQDCWLDTAAPLTVVPFRIHRAKLLDWQPTGVTTAWMGQTCDVGRIAVWLSTSSPAARRGPFPALAKFARCDPPGDPVPVLLGLEFFLTHHAELLLHPPPHGGMIPVP